MKNLADRLAELREEIVRLEQRHGRPPGSVHLVAVSKTQDAAAIRAAADAGQQAFGENYLQEAQVKMREFADRPGLEWHFIGPVQSNKTRPIAERFHWVHGVDSERIARRLSDARPPARPPLNVCLQVNISGERSKSGAAPEAISTLANAIQALPRLRLRGLMALPAPAVGLDAQRAPYAVLRRLFDELRGAGLPLDTLSIGTSADLEAAIAEGATLVRIGTALFGPRRRAGDG